MRSGIKRTIHRQMAIASALALKKRQNPMASRNSGSLTAGSVQFERLMPQ